MAQTVPTATATAGTPTAEVYLHNRRVVAFRSDQLGDSAAERAALAQRAIADLSIKVADAEHEIGSLSGGNLLKVVIGRALMTRPKVLLMDEPSRGIDIGAKADVFKVMRDLAKAGMGILFVTSDLEEVMALSDRIVVMSNGRVTAEFAEGQATQEAIVAASAVGHALAA